MNKLTKTPSTSSIGLALSLVGFLVVSAFLNLTSLRNRFTPNTMTLIGYVFAWLLATLLIVIVKRVEHRTLSSIGLKMVTGKEVLLGVVLGIVLSLTVPALTFIAGQIVPAEEQGSISSVAENVPAVFLALGIFTAGITEEIIYRGYLIERISETTGKKWLALLVSVIAFTLPHLFGWNWTHVIGVVVPLGIVLSGLYLWKRNLIFNIITHIVIDLPLVIIALLSNKA